MAKIRMAIVGLGFGSEFIPIYQNHPDVEMYAICQRNKENLNKIGDAFKVPVRYTTLEDLLKDTKVDAVHINSPIPDHAPQSIAALNAGRHVACTVPMATSTEDCMKIVEAQKRAKKVYMMMETVVYSREFLYVKDLLDSGKLGKIQFMRGCHQQDMAGWPGYWEGLPPMHYATHAVSPLLALAGKPAESVVCFGSGRINEKLIPKYGSPFAVESALIKVKDSDLACEITRSLFDTVRQYVESFDIYGTKLTFEWHQTAGEEPVLHTGGEDVKRVIIPDYASRLPAGIQRYTTKGVYDEKENVHLSFKQGSGHGGSHPHMAHEFVRAIVENRKASVDGPVAANWTSVGICAHQSAMKGGEMVKLPNYF